MTINNESEYDGHGSKGGGRRRTFDSSAEEADPNIGRTTGPIRRARGGWIQQEDQDETLRNAVAAYKGRSWKKIADFFPDRSEVQCLHRWQKVLNPELIKGIRFVVVR